MRLELITASRECRSEIISNHTTILKTRLEHLVPDQLRKAGRWGATMRRLCLRQVLWILRIGKALRHPGRSDNSFPFMPNADAHLTSGLRS
jgi:hypothetical protein